MKRLAILCALLGLLAACGAPERTQAPEEAAETETAEAAEAAPVPELEIQPGPDDIDPETGERALSSVEATVDGGRALRLEAVGMPLTEPGMAVHYGVRAVRVYDGETLLQELPASVEPGQSMTRAPTVEDALSVRDMNFDGADDMDLCATMERNAPPHYYFLWNAEAGAYLYAFTLRGAEPDPETREIVSSYSLDSQTDCEDRLRYADDGTLQLVSRKTEDWKNGTEDFPLTAYYEFRDGEAVLLRQEFTDYSDEGLIAREVREPVDGELKPVRVEILEGADGEYYVVRTEEIPLEAPEAEDAAAPEAEEAGEEFFAEDEPAPETE